MTSSSCKVSHLFRHALVFLIKSAQAKSGRYAKLLFKYAKSLFPKLWVETHQWIAICFGVDCETDKLIAHKEKALSPKEEETELQHVFNHELVRVLQSAILI